MYPGAHAKLRPLQPAFIMANSGEAVTYLELEARTNRLARLLRSLGLGRGDHYAVFMENNARYLESVGAGERSGLYCTCVNSYLTADELAYIVTNSESQVLITSVAKLDVARGGGEEMPTAEARAGRRWTRAKTDPGKADRQSRQGRRAVSENAASRTKQSARSMLYSSGTTGRPKGIVRPLPEKQHPKQQLPLFDFLEKLWQYREGMIYLSPAPLYHSAPQAAVNPVIRKGGTAIIMETFDPERYLELVEIYRVTHSNSCRRCFRAC